MTWSPGSSALPGPAPTLSGYTVLAILVGNILRADYHTASHFWPAQAIAGGGLLALSLLFIAATVWLVRRRAV